MSVLARRVTRAFYYYNRAKPDMRKKREAVFPNDARLNHTYTVLRMNVRYVAVIFSPYLFISHSVFPQLSPLR
jgi:hypothetical protein